jgi:phage regulator Rha-like protein
MTSKSKSLVTIPLERIEDIILLIRGEKVILDSSLARLYGVSTARLNQQVKRNLDRFPDDFMFGLTPEEFDTLMLQNATSKKVRGGRRKLPNAFTEHGVLMAANVLNSERAIKVSVQLIRAFVKLRQMLATNSELASKLNNLEQRYDHKFKIVFDAIRQLMNPRPPKTKPIGFRPIGSRK